MAVWSLPADQRVSYPKCVIVRDDVGDAWLHVYTAAPSTVRLHPAVVDFLRGVLADLPPYRRRYRHPTQSTCSLTVVR